jgi:hypothetical protein
MRDVGLLRTFIAAAQQNHQRLAMFPVINAVAVATIARSSVPQLFGKLADSNQP